MCLCLLYSSTTFRPTVVTYSLGCLRHFLQKSSWQQFSVILRTLKLFLAFFVNRKQKRNFYFKKKFILDTSFDLETRLKHMLAFQATCVVADAVVAVVAVADAVVAVVAVVDAVAAAEAFF